ncbi:MAG: Ribosomal-protein-serine acetyltransferase [Firmicutes bacterium ADurb.Bin300]|nr:MAG: Ribosomal-protein-serine acetyltransferase [Firmicutes bacterium ADurb.Bin300]
MTETENARMMPEMVTDDLCLRKCSQKDIEEFYRLAVNPNVTKFVQWDNHKSIEETISYVTSLEEEFSKGDRMTWAICSRAADVFMGLVSLSQINEKNFSAEAGFWLGEEHWNNGYATQALKAVIDYGLYGNLNLHRIYARHFVEHLACGRVLQKAGMIFDGVERGSVYSKGRFFDAARYAITK